MENRPINRMEVFNSIMVMLMIYCLMCYTPLVVDPEARYMMGFAMVGLVGLNVLANIVVVTIDPVKQSCKRCKVRWAKRNKSKSYNSLKHCCARMC